MGNRIASRYSAPWLPPPFRSAPTSACRYSLPSIFHNEQLGGTGTLWNVSLEGCRIDANVSMHRGIKVELLMLLPEAGGTMVVKSATVCWSRGREYGLRLVTIQAHEAARLERYITHTITEAAHAQYPPR